MQRRQEKNWESKNLTMKLPLGRSGLKIQHPHTHTHTYKYKIKTEKISKAIYHRINRLHSKLLNKQANKQNINSPTANPGGDHNPEFKYVLFKLSTFQQKLLEKCKEIRDL